MSSYSEGKTEIVDFLKRNFSSGATCLDVGACDGKWNGLLGDYFTMDAVEAFKPNVIKNDLINKYRNIYVGDITTYRYDWYDVIIFGDVIEHLTVDHAQEVLKYACSHSWEVIIGVPMCYSQGKIYGNPYEVHIQDDLTERIFKKRYPGFIPLIKPKRDYVYYHKREEFK